MEITITIKVVPKFKMPNKISNALQNWIGADSSLGFKENQREWLITKLNVLSKTTTYFKVGTMHL